MSELLDLLYDVLGKTEITPELRKVYDETEGCYDELCQAVGDKKADEIWLAAVQVGAAEQAANFASGFRLGGRLMLGRYWGQRGNRKRRSHPCDWDESAARFVVPPNFERGGRSSGPFGAEGRPRPSPGPLLALSSPGPSP